MPNSYVVLDNGTLVVERWTGTVSHDEVIAHERAQIEDRSIKPGAAVLSYAVDASFETHQEDLHQITDLYGRSDIAMEKCAVVVNDDAYDRAQLFAAQGTGHGVSTVVFNDVESACKWLGVDSVRVKSTLKGLKT
jgi:hypothetical protein